MFQLLKTALPIGLAALAFIGLTLGVGVVNWKLYGSFNLGLWNWNPAIVGGLFFIGFFVVLKFVIHPLIQYNSPYFAFNFGDPFALTPAIILIGLNNYQAVQEKWLSFRFYNHLWWHLLWIAVIAAFTIWGEVEAVNRGRLISAELSFRQLFHVTGVIFFGWQLLSALPMYLEGLLFMYHGWKTSLIALAVIPCMCGYVWFLNYDSVYINPTHP